MRTDHWIARPEMRVPSTQEAATRRYSEALPVAAVVEGLILSRSPSYDEIDELLPSISSESIRASVQSALAKVERPSASQVQMPSLAISTIWRKPFLTGAGGFRVPLRQWGSVQSVADDTLQKGASALPMST